MLGFITRFFPVLGRRKFKTIEKFVAAVKREGCKKVQAAGRLDSPGLVISLRGCVAFVAHPSKGRDMFYEQTLFENELPNEALFARLYLLADQKMREMRRRLPEVEIEFQTIYFPGNSIHLDEETRGKLLNLAIQTGVV